MADEYLRALRAFRPNGPYLLGGYCNGGLVALEMARRLQAQGEQVDFLLAIDTVSANVRLRWLQVLVKRLAKTCNLSPEDEQRLFLTFHGAIVSVARRVESLGRSPKDFLRNLYRRLRGMPSTHGQPSVLDLAYRRAVHSYIPPPYPGRVTLFVTDELAGKRFTRDWRTVTEDCEVYRMPGDHLTVVTQHIQVVAEQLRVCLERAQRQDGPGAKP
jgi:thioesterase domain-containing protein